MPCLTNHDALRRGRWRALAVWLALALVLANYLHLGHTHAAEDRATAAMCGFCTSQGRDLAGPIAAPLVLPEMPAPRWIELSALESPELDLVAPAPRARGPPAYLC
jgi:hypothetical protein